MTDKRDTISPPGDRFSLRRWSRRKLAAAQAPAAAPAAPPVPAGAAPAASESAAAAPTVLPPVESLTFDSDFKLFFGPKVDESLKRAALKQLFRDPRFNVMDGLDTYIDDYTRADPIPEDMLRQLVQTRYIFDPPKTEISAEGHVIDSPVEESAPEEPKAIAAPAGDAAHAAKPPDDAGTSADEER